MNIMDRVLHESTKVICIALTAKGGQTRATIKKNTKTENYNKRKGEVIAIGMGTGGLYQTKRNTDYWLNKDE